MKRILQRLVLLLLYVVIFANCTLYNNQQAEGFRRYYNHLIRYGQPRFNKLKFPVCAQIFLCRPNDLPNTSDYHLFKEGILPMWEVQNFCLQHFYFILCFFFANGQHRTMRISWVVNGLCASVKDLFPNTGRIW